MNREEILQKYFHNRLLKKERAQFEMDLQNSKQLQKEYEEYKHLQAAIKQSEYNRLKKELKGLEASSGGNKSLLYNWKIAATLLILVSIGGLWHLSQPADVDKIYAQYFTEYPNTLKPVVRGLEDVKTLAFTYYENNEYNKAASAFSSLLDKHEDADIRFYYALSLLNDKKLELAKHELEDLLLTNTQYKAQLHWYLGLIEMKFGNKAKAVEYFEMLQHPQAFNHGKAQKLIAKLSR